MAEVKDVYYELPNGELFSVEQDKVPSVGDTIIMAELPDFEVDKVTWYILKGIVNNPNTIIKSRVKSVRIILKYKSKQQ